MLIHFRKQTAEICGPDNASETKRENKMEWQEKRRFIADLLNNK